MNNKTKLIICSISLLVAFSVGRYTVPKEIKIETKIVEVKSKEVDKEMNKHKETTETKIVRPDGTTEITTKTVEDTDKKINITELNVKESEKLVEKKSLAGGLSILALGGMTWNGPSPTPVYGALVSKQIIGPISIGIWGLSDKTVGAAVGISL